jgi:hypothetical protein
MNEIVFVSDRQSEVAGRTVDAGGVLGNVLPTGAGLELKADDEQGLEVVSERLVALEVLGLGRLPRRQELPRPRRQAPNRRVHADVIHNRLKRFAQFRWLAQRAGYIRTLSSTRTRRTDVRSTLGNEIAPSGIPEANLRNVLQLARGHFLFQMWSEAEPRTT